MELTVEALPDDLCPNKFEREMNSVDLVDVSVVSVKSEDVIPTGKRRGRPKKPESPVTERKFIRYYCGTRVCPKTKKTFFVLVPVKEEPDVEDSYEYQLMYDCEPVIKDDDDDDDIEDDDPDNFATTCENDQSEIKELEKELENLSEEYEKPKRKRTRKTKETNSQPVTLVFFILPTKICQ